MSANPATSELQNHQREFIEGALATGALKFGSFILKSGRSVNFLDIIVCNVLTVCAWKDIAVLLQRWPVEHRPTHIGRRDFIRDPHLPIVELANISTSVRRPFRTCVQRHPICGCNSVGTVQDPQDLRRLCI